MLNNIKPFFNVTKAFGCTPHKIIGRNLIVTKKGIFYSGLCSLVFIFFFVFAMHDILFVWEFSKYTYFNSISTIMCYTTLLADGIIGMFYNDRLSHAFKCLDEYDNVTRFRRSTHFRNKSTLNCCRLITIMTIACWINITIFSYVTHHPGRFPHGVMYFIAFGCLSTQILKFCGIMWLLYQRFNHLSQLVLPEELIGSRFFPVNREWKNFTLKDIWWSHSKLTTAAREINTVYSVQLLLWIVVMSVNIIEKVYTITKMNFGVNIYSTMEKFFCVVTFFMNLLFIIISCHLTSNQAEEVVTATFSAHSTPFRRRNENEDMMELATYFTVYELRFSAAADFIHIHLPLLMSIIGVMTTYLFIMETSIE